MPLSGLKYHVSALASDTVQNDPVRGDREHRRTSGKTRQLPVLIADDNAAVVIFIFSFRHEFDDILIGTVRLRLLSDDGDNDVLH